MHSVLLDDPLEALALRSSDHVDQVADDELCDIEINCLVECGAVRQTEFADKLFRLGPSLLKMANQRLGHALRFLRVEADLHAGVAVVFLTLELKCGVAPASMTVTGVASPLSS